MYCGSLEGSELGCVASGAFGNEFSDDRLGIGDENDQDSLKRSKQPDAKLYQTKNF